jgi:hypothetical protein
MHFGAREDFTHILPAADSHGIVTAGVINAQLGLGVKIEYPLAQMPRLGLWQHYGRGGEYAAAYEPMTGFVEGRARDRELQALLELEPGESRAYSLKYTILDNPAALDAFRALG